MSNQPKPIEPRDPALAAALGGQSPEAKTGPAPGPKAGGEPAPIIDPVAAARRGELPPVVPRQVERVDVPEPEDWSDRAAQPKDILIPQDADQRLFEEAHAEAQRRGGKVVFAEPQASGAAKAREGIDVTIPGNASQSAFEKALALAASRGGEVHFGPDVDTGNEPPAARRRHDRDAQFDFEREARQALAEGRDLDPTRIEGAN